MNTNNGYTKFETGEQVQSVENRLVTFSNHVQHTGSTNNCDHGIELDNTQLIKNT